MATSDRALLLQLFQDLGKPLARIKRVGGQTNRNYAVRTKKGKMFFTRLPWEREDVVNRTIEGKNILALSCNKKLQRILPKYYSYILKKKNILTPKTGESFDVPDGTMVAEFIEGRGFTMKEFQQKKYQKVFASLFHTFHTSGVRFVNPYNVFRDEIKKYRLAAIKYQFRKFLDENTIRQLKQIEKEAAQKLPAFKQGISTHNDFIFQNFLVGKNGNIYLLDFEYAGLNKKGGILYDFGFLFADNLFRNPPMTRELFERFLYVADKAYKKKLNRNQIYWSAIAAILVQVWWGILRYFSVPPKERLYFKEYVQKRVKGAFKLYKSLKEKES